MYLVVNAGSSSLKTALFSGEKELVRCYYDRLHKDITWLRVTRASAKKETRSRVELNDAAHALRHNIIYLVEQGFLKHHNDIKVVVHRVVHGGEFYKKAVKITEKVKQHIEALSILAPLHNPHNLAAINASEHLLNHAKQVAVFDTAYHQTIPPEAYRYGIPEELYEKHKIRKYGFHGTSHKFLASEAKRLCGAKKVITCHLGNGSSVTANKNGKSIDTSMGFTPTDGLVMGTRSGALDPEVVIYLLRQIRYSPKRLHDFLNKESGMLGLTHFSSDVRDIWKEASTGKGDRQEDASLALLMLSYHIKCYVGEYAAILGGVDAIVFSGGIGQNAWYIREDALLGLDFLGIKLDEKKNKKAVELKEMRMVHKTKSKVNILVIPANEELQMVREAKVLLRR
ncbi:acetate/propionate family kinase [Candidatus Woesearchaeota archaeon]|nr:acetate/propionate family kinase [Candidatus Woesearchaeota archaeon]